MRGGRRLDVLNDACGALSMTGGARRGVRRLRREVLAALLKDHVPFAYQTWTGCCRKSEEAQAAACQGWARLRRWDI